MRAVRRSLTLALLCTLLCTPGAWASDTWLITGYDACIKCCGKAPNHPAYGITASGKRATVGMVACNWLPFGTRVKVNGKVYTVQDRGAKSLFGDSKHHIKHLDLYFDTHKQARAWGKQYAEVEVL